jgi:hypothetical protein
MLLNLEIIGVCIYTLKNVEYTKYFCMFAIEILWIEFLTRLGYNSGCAKKLCQVVIIRAVIITIVSVCGRVNRLDWDDHPVKRKPIARVQHISKGRKLVLRFPKRCASSARGFLVVLQPTPPSSPYRLHLTRDDKMKCARQRRNIKLHRDCCCSIHPPSRTRTHRRRLVYL